MHLSLRICRSQLTLLFFEQHTHTLCHISFVNEQSNFVDKVIKRNKAYTFHRVSISLSTECSHFREERDDNWEIWYIMGSNSHKISTIWHVERTVRNCQSKRFMKEIKVELSDGSIIHSQFTHHFILICRRSSTTMHNVYTQERRCERYEKTSSVSHSVNQSISTFHRWSRKCNCSTCCCYEWCVLLAKNNNVLSSKFE